MPLFQVSGSKVIPVSQSDFAKGKTLQGLIEANSEAVFSCRLVASEFSTGSVHGGRIDTLALSEDGNPVIIEYKKVVSSDLVNQSLFYLAWIEDHRGDFEVAAKRALGPKVEIDWNAIRVICIAPSYRKYDVHAVQVMGRDIELWTYRRFENDTFYLERLHQGEVFESVSAASGKNPIMVAAGKKAAETRRLGGWTIDGHMLNKSESIVALFEAIREFMISLDPAIEETPNKLYIAYRTTKNILCVEVQKQKILLFVKLNPKKHAGPQGISRDVSDIGHFGTGDLELTLKNLSDLESAKPFLVMAYEQVGG